MARSCVAMGPDQTDVSLSLGHGDGIEVSVLAFYSEDPSSNPAGY